jgi:ligand-binding sensor domain-containing protein
MRTVLFCIALLLVLFHSNVFAEDAWTYITEIDGQEIGYVGSMASEDDGTIWVCATGGVFKYKEKSWINESAHFENADFGRMIYVDISPNGNVWFSSYPNSLFKYDGENWYSYNYTGSTVVLSGLSVDSQENVWCSTNNNAGLVKFNGKDWNILKVDDGLVRTSVTRVKVSPNDEVWVRYGNISALDKPAGVFQTVFGVSRYDGEKWETFNTENGLKRNMVDDIAFGPDGSTYISYGGLTGDPEIGIMRFDGSSWKTISESVNGKLEFDQDGTLWIGHVFSKLYKYDGISVEKCPDKPSEIPRYTQTMGFDSDGNVWLGVYGGVVKYDIQTGVNNNLKPLDILRLNNYPNPFNSSTNILFELPESSHVTLAVYNANGQKVTELIDELMLPGLYKVVFKGDGLPSGLYFSRLEASALVKSNSMLLIK